MSVSVKDLINRRIALPTLPGLFVRLDQAINNPRTSLSDIGNLLLEDSALCARLLRIANSSFYNFPHRVDSIPRALALIGTKQLRDLVLATSVTHLFRGIPEDLIDMPRFWQHSVSCGVAARELAAREQSADDEYFYLLGILHDIGHLMIYQAMAADARLCLDRSQREGRPHYQLEQEVLGFDHAQLGGDLLAHWHLPPSLSEPIRNHHAPAVALEFQVAANTLNRADALVSSLGMGSSSEPVMEIDPQQLLSEMGVAERDQATLIDRIETQSHEIVDAILGNPT